MRGNAALGDLCQHGCHIIMPTCCLVGLPKRIAALCHGGMVLLDNRQNLCVLQAAAESVGAKQIEVALLNIEDLGVGFCRATKVA